jgi:thymidylate synthase
MKTYLDALKQVLDQGTIVNDRTQVGTISLFGMQQRYDLRHTFPAVTTKKLAWKACVGELLWMIEGSGDERRLAEITHGSSNGTVTIWTPNALAGYWKPKAKFNGDLGRVYGVQWRKWQGPNGSVDQIADLIAGIKSNPHSRRHILTAWNPGELDQMALPPCHLMAQFYVKDVPGGKSELSCQMYQRSCDMFLGVPFNIASYSLLTHMIAQVCNLNVGEFVHSLGDAHIYLNHVEQVKEQLSRVPMAAPRLKLNSSIKDINNFTMKDIKLENYQSHAGIKAPMAV